MNSAEDLIEECGIKLFSGREVSLSRKAGPLYKREGTIIRAIVVSALSAYVESGKSVLTPIRALDGIGATGVTGLLLRKEFHESQVEVTINDPDEQAFNIIKKNAEINNLAVEVTNRDACVLMHERAFNFIHLDCHTSASQYLDAAFKNIPKRGVLILTTSDDSALYGRTPEIAMRNYGGMIVKTAYYKELAIRLVLAGVARSAARFNKAIKVLCCVSVKASFTLVVEVLKGAVKANECLQEIKLMLHCSFCEDWAFLPNTQYPLDAPGNLLRCDCRHKCPGKTACYVGPIWSGSIFCTNFISSVIDKLNSKKNAIYSACQSSVSLLSLILEEAYCRGRKPQNLRDDEEKREPKRRRNSDWKPIESGDEVESSPPFYFSLHQRQCGRGRSRVPRADAAVIRLRESEFRASRTHFDPCAIRTDAPPTEICRLLGMI